MIQGQGSLLAPPEGYVFEGPGPFASGQSRVCLDVKLSHYLCVGGYYLQEGHRMTLRSLDIEDIRMSGEDAATECLQWEAEACEG